MAPIDSKSMGAPRFGSYSRTDDRRKKSFQGVKFDIAPFNIIIIIIMFISPFSQTHDSNTWQISVTLKKGVDHKSPAEGCINVTH